jgi:hypothetical protein
VELEGKFTFKIKLNFIEHNIVAFALEFRQQKYKEM